MAKAEGEQHIPAELLDLYRAALNTPQADFTTKKRFPYRLPQMQEGGNRVSTAQKVQRERFKIAIANFADVGAAQRQRWYDNSPPWGSFLWYYNYFIMSSLAGNANPEQGGAGVVKSIQFVKETVEVGGAKTFLINAVDPAKTVVMMFGNSYISDKIQHHEGATAHNTVVQVNMSPNIDPDIAEIKLRGAGGFMTLGPDGGDGWWNDWVVTEVTAAYVKIKLTLSYGHGLYGWSIDVIEHKAQTVYPVIDSVAAEAVVISWANTPSVAAAVSLIVIEYI